MSSKKITALTGNINITEFTGPADTEISGFCIDSRRFVPGDAYFAQPGIHLDGHDFIDDVVRKGCRAVIHSRPLNRCEDGVTYLRTDNVREALSPMSAAFYGHPSRSLVIIGVTGTDGKSSTVSYIYQLLKLLGCKAGFFSTVEYDNGNGISGNPFRMSTPESCEIQRILAEMRDNGLEYAVIESTSHGLARSFSRLADVFYSAGILTNISHEHLEFHGTLQQYANDKANLFRQLRTYNGKAPVGIIRSEEPFFNVFTKDYAGNILTYSCEDETANAFAHNISETASGMAFDLILEKKQFNCFVPLSGHFNINNVISSVLAVIAVTGFHADEIIMQLPRLHGVRGRMERIVMGQDFPVLVDYAHSPGSFEKLLPLMKKSTRGRLIILFGSAGERDTEKRPIMGRIASEYADIIVLSDEDPRGEASKSILDDIAAGCTGKKTGIDLFVVPDRTEGIRTALSLADKSDTVLLLGKGHESTIIYSDGPVPWDEAGTVRATLREMGFNKPGS